MLQGLVGADCLAELFAGLEVVDREIERGLHGTGRFGCKPGDPGLEHAVDPAFAGKPV